MKNYRNLYPLLLIISGIIYSCGNGSDYKYPQDKSISDRQGILVDSTRSYYPDIIQLREGITESNLNLPPYPSDLFVAHEPVLYNYYLDRDMYRLLIHKDTANSIILSINKKDDKIWVIIKEVIHNPYESQTAEKIVADSVATDITVLEYGLISNFSVRIKELSVGEWNQFEQLISDLGFWTIQPVDKANVDTDYFILEGHFKHFYRFVYRSSSDNYLQPIADYLLKLSDLK